MPVNLDRAPRVLVVEDDREIASALALELGHAGYEPSVVSNGPAALSAVSEWIRIWCCSTLGCRCSTASRCVAGSGQLRPRQLSC